MKDSGDNEGAEEKPGGEDEVRSTGDRDEAVESASVESAFSASASSRARNCAQVS